MVASLASLPSFPGAEGAGARTSGGRGGRVLEVTNLNDSGPGSLRAAIEATGARIVVFRVAGTIALESRLRVLNGALTIAGQTAPGEGICLKNYSLSIEASNVIVRYIRSRLGDESKQQSDSLTVWRGTHDVMVDHCTASWSVDEALSLAGDVSNVTVQWCLISEGLRHSVHEKGNHAYGSLMRASGPVSLHHNLWAHNDSRNPRLGDSYGKPPYPTFDVRNNVIYDYGSTCSGLTQGNFGANYVGNTIRSGPSSTAKTPITVGGPSDLRFFIQGNEVVDNAALTRDNRQFFNTMVIDGKTQVQTVSEPFAMEPVHTTTASEAYEAVLASVGASLPARDAVDARIVREVKTRSGHIIDSQRDVGGWPMLKTGTAPPDSDHDGMPDAWETQYGFNPRSEADAASDADGDGYTNIEEFLNGTNPKQFVNYRDFKNNVFNQKVETQVAMNSEANTMDLKPKVGGVQANIEYARPNGEPLLLDAFVPPGEGPFPVAILVHGGGWGSGRKNGDIAIVCDALSKANIAWFSIDYRLAPQHRWPACYNDVETAIAWVKAHAANYKGDPQRIALVGYSAGGQLAVRAAMRATDATRVQAVAALAAPTDLVADTARRGGVSKALQDVLGPEKSGAEIHAVLVQMSPLNDVKPGLPPFFFMHGTADKSVPYEQSLNLQARLKAVNVSTELLTLPEAPHAIAQWEKTRPDYATELANWIRRTLG